MDDKLTMTPTTRLRRIRERGAYDRKTIYGILDAMPLCHIGYVLDDAPVVMPTIQWREGDHVYWHASSGGRGIKTAQTQKVCLTVSLLDGLVLARSGLHHSANYRSVMIFGQPAKVSDPEQKKQKLDGLVDSLFPGRSAMLRPHHDAELKQTTVLSMPIEEASAKVRHSGVVDEEEDYDWPVWSGVIPVGLQVFKPQPDPRNLPGIEIPDHAKDFKLG